MALYGGSRDVSLIRKIGRELMGDIISQQAAFYKFKLDETQTNMYGEAAGEKFYIGPVLLNCTVDRGDQEHPTDDFGVDYKQGIVFNFLRDDLLSRLEEFNLDNMHYGADLVPEVGDIILYNEGYYEVDSTNANQYFVGKNPNYPNNPNPLETNLEEFGTNLSIICTTHYVPADKVGITQERL